ncbi:AMP-binding protein, partial [Rhizobium sp.]|uniref:AMP-binding protein n=1 Tax=Rhizobium sp. TaxID=391 RepID=UPI0028AA5F67
MTPHVLLHHLLTARAESSGEALVFKEKSLSYREFSQAAARCAAALQNAGAERGDRVVVVLPRGIEECWSIFGVSMAGGVFVPVNALLKAQQIRHIVGDCGAKIVISSAAMTDELKAALEDLPHVKVLQAEDMDNRPVAPAKASAAIGEDLAAILYTSGSTGSPKGVMLSHRNLLAGARIVRTYLEITEKDRILSILPFSFDYGLNQLLTAVEQGATTIISTFRLGDDI